MISGWVVYFLSFCLPLLVSAFYIPLMGIILSLIDCSNLEIGLINSSELTIYCFEGSHIIHFTVTLLFLICMATIAFGYNFFIYEVNLQVNEMSKINGYANLWDCLFRTGLPIIVLFIRKDYGRQAMWVYMLLLTFIIFMKFCF